MPNRSFADNRDALKRPRRGIRLFTIFLSCFAVAFITGFWLGNFRVVGPQDPVAAVSARTLGVPSSGFAASAAAAAPAAVTVLDLTESNAAAALSSGERHVVVLFCDPTKRRRASCSEYRRNLTDNTGHFRGRSLVFAYADVNAWPSLLDYARGATLPAIRFFPKGRPSESTLFLNTYRCGNMTDPECYLKKKSHRAHASVNGFYGFSSGAIGEWIAWQVSNEHLLSYRDRHAGQRCVIVGNGPSLNKMDLSFMKNEVSFAANKIYLGFERFGFTPSYYVCFNKLVLQQVLNANVSRLLPPTTPKFVSLRGWPAFALDADGDSEGDSEGGGVVYLKTDYSRPSPGGCRDPRQFCSEGATVTYGSLSLAYWMGCAEAVLIGVDHYFRQQGRPNEAQTATEPDSNHFDPNYFGPGTEWNLADLNTSELAYGIALRQYAAAGRRIVDATLDGRCRVFPRVHYRKLFFGEEVSVSD